MGVSKDKPAPTAKKQRPGSSKEDATSPTVLLEVVLITSVINAYK